MGGIGAEDANETGARAELCEGLANDRVERVACEHCIESVAPWRLRDRPGDELQEIDLVPRERLDRAVERARLVIGHEREGGAPGRTVRVQPHVVRDGDEARVRLGVVAHVAQYHGEPVQTGSALARYRDLGRIPVLGDLSGCVGGRRSRDPGRPRHGREQLPALIERDRVRADDPDVLERKRGRPDEVVPDRQHGLRADRERGVVEEVVRLVHRARERALDREDAEQHRSVGGRFGDCREARERDELCAVREQSITRRGAVGAVPAGVRDGGRERHVAERTAGSALVRCCNVRRFCEREDDVVGAVANPGLAESLERLGTETAFSVLARARELERQGREVIHLEIGEPDFDTPLHICRAAADALEAGQTHYCPSAGIPELRAEAARYLSRTRAVEIDPANVLVGTGAKPFLFFTILATCNPGDEVVYPDPGFPIYESAIRWAGATPVPLPLLEERDFAFDLDDLGSRLRPRTKLVILNSPHNPTGGALSPEETAAAAAMLADSGAWVLSDEVYSQMLYDGEFASVASHPGLLERTILLDGLSKTYAMTGWRCGFAAVPEALVDPLVRFFVNSTSCVPPFVQLAGVTALTGPQDEPRAMVEEFRARRELIVDGLNALPGVSCRTPRGAFYVFPNVSEVPIGADELADRLLQESGIAVLAGSAFGDVGKDNLRVSYANSRENLSLALARMRDFLEAL